MQKLKFLICTLLSVSIIGLSSISAFAMPAPVSPSGFTPQVIPGGAGSMSPQTIANNVWFSLGVIPENAENDPLGILSDPISDETYFQRTEDALNSKDSGLGTTFVNFIKTYTAGLGTVWKNALTIPSDLWSRLKSAFSDPSITFEYDTISNIDIDFEYIDNLYYSIFNSRIDNSSKSLINGVLDNAPCSVLVFHTYTSSINYTNTNFYIIPNLESISYRIEGDMRYFDINLSSPPDDGTLICPLYMSSYNDLGNFHFIRLTHYETTQTLDDWNYDTSLVDHHIYGRNSSVTTSKTINVNEDISALLENGDYGLVNKNSTYENDLFNENEVTLNPADDETLLGYISNINENIGSLSDYLRRLGTLPVNTSTGVLTVPDLSLADAQQIITNSSPVEATDTLIDDLFPKLGDFEFFIPDGIAGVMNWVAIQMQTVFSITQMQNVFLVTSTIVVVALLLGLARLWR